MSIFTISLLLQAWRVLSCLPALWDATAFQILGLTLWYLRETHQNPNLLLFSILTVEECLNLQEFTRPLFYFIIHHLPFRGSLTCLQRCWKRGAKEKISLFYLLKIQALLSKGYLELWIWSTNFASDISLIMYSISIIKYYFVIHLNYTYWEKGGL